MGVGASQSGASTVGGVGESVWRSVEECGVIVETSQVVLKFHT